MDHDGVEPKKTADGRLRFWLHQEHTLHREKELVSLGSVPAEGEVLTLYVGPKQLIEVEVLAVEDNNLFVRRIHGINHYLYVLHLIATELYLLPLDLRNGLAAELARVFERALTDESPMSKDHCNELMRILKLVREERKLEAPMSQPSNSSLNSPMNPPVATRPADVVTFLRDKYRAAMEDKNVELAQTDLGGSESPQIDVEAEMSKIEVFLNFCWDLLGKQTRPSEIFHTPDNFGIKLTSGESFVISTSLDVPGSSMQPSHAQPVTGCHDYNEAVGDAVPVTKSLSVAPAGTEDRSIDGAGLVDKTAAQPQRRMDE